MSRVTCHVLRRLRVAGVCLVVAGCAVSHHTASDRPADGRAMAVRPVDPSRADFTDLVSAAMRGEWSAASAIFTGLDHRWQRYTPVQRTLLRGIANVELGRFAEARQLLEEIRGSYSLLDDVLLYYLGEAHLGAGNGAAAGQVFSTLVAQHPESRWYLAARERLAAAAMADARWDEAAAILTGLKNGASRGRIDRALAALAVRRGDAATAESLYLVLYTQAASAGELGELRAGLALFQERFHRDPLRGFSVEQRAALARDFLARHLASEAARLLEGLDGSRRDAEWQELLGQAYYEAREYAKASHSLCALADRGGAGMERAALLRLCATAAARAGATDDAIKRNRQILDEFPGSTHGATALYKLGFLLMDSGRCGAAIEAYRQWLAASPRASGDTDEALWNIAWCHYRSAAFPQALAALEEVEAVVGHHRDWQARVAYWRARILEAAGRRGEARAAYQRVAGEFGAQYYGLLAARRLKGKEDGSAWSMRHRSESDDVREMVENQPHSGVEGGTQRALPVGGATRAPVNDIAVLSGAKARELAHLGLWEWALEEEARSSDAEGLYRVAVDRLGARWQLDAALVRAVIQQESQFRADAVSPAGAIGLMQLMPATAARLAQELHWRDFDPAALYRPVANVRLGMWYLRSLDREFEGRVPLMLASYNAGEDAVRRWIDGFWQRRGKSGQALPPMEEFIEEIPYTETINYVKKILRNYWAS